MNSNKSSVKIQKTVVEALEQEWINESFKKKLSDYATTKPDHKRQAKKQNRTLTSFWIPLPKFLTKPL